MAIQAANNYYVIQSYDIQIGGMTSKFRRIYFERIVKTTNETEAHLAERTASIRARIYTFLSIHPVKSIVNDIKVDRLDTLSDLTIEQQDKILRTLTAGNFEITNAPNGGVDTLDIIRQG